MPTCRSWRYHPESGDVDSLPGENREAWTLCRNKVPYGTKRCDTCLNELLFHPNPDIRLSLVYERGVRKSTLMHLRDNDVSVAVSAEAELMLEKLDKSPRRNRRAEAADENVPDRVEQKLAQAEAHAGLWNGVEAGYDAIAENSGDGESPVYGDVVLETDRDAELLGVRIEELPDARSRRR